MIDWLTGVSRCPLLLLVIGDHSIVSCLSHELVRRVHCVLHVELRPTVFASWTVSELELGQVPNRSLTLLTHAHCLGSHRKKPETEAYKVDIVYPLLFCSSGAWLPCYHVLLLDLQCITTRWCFENIMYNCRTNVWLKCPDSGVS